MILFSIIWGIRLPIQDNVCTTGKPVALKKGIIHNKFAK